jgi:hypothetical protein
MERKDFHLAEELENYWRPSGQFSIIAEKWSGENSYLAAELENYSGLQVSVIYGGKIGARELPSGGRIGELLQPSGQLSFMLEKWSERTPIWRRNWRTTPAFRSV